MWHGRVKIQMKAEPAYCFYIVPASQAKILWRTEKQFSLMYIISCRSYSFMWISSTWVFKFQYKCSFKEYGLCFFLSLIHSEFWRANVLWTMTPPRGIVWGGVKTWAHVFWTTVSCRSMLLLPFYFVPQTGNREMREQANVY